MISSGTPFSPSSIRWSNITAASWLTALVWARPLLEDGSTDYFTVGKKVKIDLTDMDYKTWRTELQQNAENLELLTLMVADITPEHDLKLQNLLELLDEKMRTPSMRAIKRC